MAGQELTRRLTVSKSSSRWGHKKTKKSPQKTIVPRLETTCRSTAMLSLPRTQSYSMDAKCKLPSTPPSKDTLLLKTHLQSCSTGCALPMSPS